MDAISGWEAPQGELAEVAGTGRVSSPEAATEGQDIERANRELRVQPDPYILIHESKAWQTPSKPGDSSKSRLERYADQVGWTRDYARSLQGEEYASRPEAAKVAEKIAACGSWLMFNHYYTHPQDLKRLTNGFFCQQYHHCRFCAARYSAKSMKIGLDKVSASMVDRPELRPYLLTLTLRDQEHLPSMVKSFFGAWTKCMAQRRDAIRRKRHVGWAKWEGGILSTETKIGKNSKLWHFHGHAVILADAYAAKREYWEQYQRQWSEALGYYASVTFSPLKCNSDRHLLESSHEEEVRHFKNRLGKELLEVFKYALKTNDLEHSQHFQAAVDLKGKRLRRSFGCLRSVDVDSVLDDVEDLSDWPFVELFYRYQQGSFHEARKRGGGNYLRENVFDEWNAGKDVAEK